jgi:NAD(P)-dependent dehydrogenase (short-subunit alcohol dehydrogenase family)
MRLTKRTALITGGNSGIGLATAKRFVEEGAYVFITGRRAPELTAAVKEIGRNVTGIQGDVANLANLDGLFAQIKREKGGLDIVFANAGFSKWGPLGKITEEDYDSLFNVNVKGLLFTVQKALPMMPDKKASVSLSASHGGPIDHPSLNQVKLETVMQALSDPRWIAIICALAKGGELACSEIALDVSTATRSYQFDVLRAAGLIFSRTE